MRANCEIDCAPCSEKRCKTCLLTNFPCLMPKVAGAGRGVEKNTMLSMELFENGCKLGNGDACDLAGRSLLERSAQLQVGAAPTATSTTLAAAASTSSSLSSSTSPSTGLAEAALLRERGLTLLEHGCHDLENAPSCNFLGELFLVGRFGVEVDKKRAAPLLELACERFEMTACRNLMVMYSRGDGVERDFAKAEAYREQSIAAVQQQTGVNMPAFLQERFQKMQQRANAGPTRS